jgi:hypothetical protein
MIDAAANKLRLVSAVLGFVVRVSTSLLRLDCIPAERVEVPRTRRAMINVDLGKDDLCASVHGRPILLPDWLLQW